VGPPVCFLKDIPREILSIKFVKPAPRGNHGCTRTIPLKNAQVRAIRHELRGAFCLRLYGVSLFAGSMLYILGTMIKMPQKYIFGARNQNVLHSKPLPESKIENWSRVYDGAVLDSLRHGFNARHWPPGRSTLIGNLVFLSC
jgi:hypothetical protein